MLQRHVFKFNTLSAAIKHCETLGWGYDVAYNQTRKRHTKKSYADNFMWKGPAAPEDAYD